MRRLLFLFKKVLTRLSDNFVSFYATSKFRTSLYVQGALVGKKIKAIKSSPIFWKQYGGCAKIIIGDNVTFNSYADHSYNCRCKIMVEKNGRLTIGNHTGLNGVLIYCQDSITIGDWVKIGGGTRIFDTNHHPLNWRDRRLDDITKVRHAPIIIEDDVFIGACCFIMQGVTIGKKSIVAAGSVVTKSIPENELWGGNPARYIKSLQQ